MNYVKKNLSFGTRVRVVNTNSSMDGVIGIISGSAMIHVFDTMIVSLRKPIDLGTGLFQSFVIPETCLEVIPGVTKVIKVTEKNMGSKRVSMDTTDFRNLQQDALDGTVSQVEIRISKTNELLYAIPGHLVSLFYAVENPYVRAYTYKLINYAKALRAMQREVKAKAA